MVENFNRILQAFGANRIKLLEVYDRIIKFKIDNFGVFMIGPGGAVSEWVDGFEKTARSRWIEAIGEGKTRNDAGEMV